MVSSGEKDATSKVLDKAPSSGQQPPPPPQRGAACTPLLPTPPLRLPMASPAAPGTVAARPGCRARKPKIILQGRTGAAGGTPRHRGGVPGGVWADPDSRGPGWGARRGKIPGRKVAASRGQASSRAARAARSPSAPGTRSSRRASRGRTRALRGAASSPSPRGSGGRARPAPEPQPGVCAWPSGGG